MTTFIAEIGINHNGNLDLAKKMIVEAVNAGANIVKFQTFWGLKSLEKYEFSKDEWILLKSFCDSLGTEFMSSAHWGSSISGYKDEDYDVIDFVDNLVKRHKIASPYLTNEKYLKYIASKGKSILLSTGSIEHKSGMATLSEIKRALGWLNGNGLDITLLHCISKYPTRERYFNRVKQLKKFGKKVGISDHTKNIDFPMEFPVIEKHFMLDENCIDISVSIISQQFKEMVQNYETKESL